ncbi:MAG: hypothetical protein KAS04_01320, partial [Candidatus Aenigmarchaeota archaeon]|nr:hypothetical protein [Candidatus Aenigmarchaeota archaeon]
MGTKLTQVEKAWIACAIDSEGSIVIQKTKWNPKYPSVVVYNTDMRYIEATAWIMNHNINSWKKHNNGGGP